MKLGSFFEKGLIRIPLRAKTTEEVIHELIDETILSGHPELDAKQIFENVMKTEFDTRNTVGAGVFFPHARIDTLGDFILAFGIAPHGIDIPTPDGMPVNFVLLIICPYEKNTLLLQMRSAFLKVLNNATNRKRLLAAKNPSDVVQILEDANIELRRELVAGDVMRTDVVSSKPTSTLEEILLIMLSANVDTVPIIDDKGVFLGVVNGGGILRIAIPKYMDNVRSMRFITSDEPLMEIYNRRKDLTANDLLEKSSELKIVHQSTSIMEVAFRLVQSPGRIVYVCEDEKLLGIITRRSLLTRLIIE